MLYAGFTSLSLVESWSFMLISLKKPSFFVDILIIPVFCSRLSNCKKGPPSNAEDFASLNLLFDFSTVSSFSRNIWPQSSISIISMQFVELVLAVYFGEKELIYLDNSLLEYGKDS